jgi:hypothetical protein
VKNIIVFFILSFAAFSFSVILQNCFSAGSMVTNGEMKRGSEQVENSRKWRTEKENSSLPTINPSIDTTVILRESKKVVVVDKRIPPDKILLLDKYLAANSISTKKEIQISRLQSGCIHTVTYNEIANFYKQAMGKYLGIWVNPNVVPWSKCHNQYGFTNILAEFSSASYAVSSGFQHDSIMIGLPGAATLWKDIYNDNNPAYNFYFVDEPYKQMSIQEFAKISRFIYQKNSRAKLLFTDYYWPDINLPCYFTSGNKHSIWNYYLNKPNVFIMCDQYDGNWCGDASSFWQKYKSVYGVPFRNFSNWITLDSDNINDWKDLLNLASSFGMNLLWIYGLDKNVDESRISEFCSNAWQEGWLLRLEKNLVVVYKCTNPYCHWPDKGEWAIYSAYYADQQYVPY